MLCRLLVILALLVLAPSASAHDGEPASSDPYIYAGIGAPSMASAEFDLPGTEDVVTVASAEQDAQVRLYVPGTAVSAPGSTATIKAEPLAPTEQPSDAKIAGNVYRVSAASPSGPVIISNAAVAIALRLPPGFPAEQAPKLYYRAQGGAWRSLLTFQTGGDIFQAGFAGVGDYALAIAKTSPAPVPAKSFDWRIVTSASAAIAVVLLGLLLALARRRLRRRGD